VQLELKSPLDGWCVDLGAVPDPVFAGRAVGDGVAIDPTGDCLHAPCDATVLSVHAAGHAVALRAAGGVELLVHLGIDTVALGGDGFVALVEPGAVVRTGDPLIRFDLDRIVRDATAAVTPVLVTSPARIERLSPDGACTVGAPLLRVTPEDTGARDHGGAVHRRHIVVRLPHGLHARPAARVAQALRSLDAAVMLIRGDACASAASSVSLLGLSAGCGDELLVEARGADAQAALDRVAAILSDDSDHAVSPPAAIRAGAEALPSGALRGVGAAPGLAIGPAAWLAATTLDLPATGDGVAAERQRLAVAIASVAADLANQSAGVGGEIAAAHDALLADPDLRAEAEARVDGGVHAATAFRDATAARAATLHRSSDPRIAERADDLIDLGLRVARAALGGAGAPATYSPGAILLADELLPSHLLAPAARMLGGVALARGGATSHVAILAAGLGIPMVVAVGAPLHTIAAGNPVVIDGDAGAVLPRPDAGQHADAESRIARQRAAEAAARAAGDRPTTTRDGVPIGVHANLGSLADADAAMREGAEGSGLLRTEFLFLDRTAPPDLAEQAACYGAMAARLGDRPLTVRLLDVGGDKPAAYLALPAEENPALGERGVRVLLARPDLMDTQLAAILEANGAGTIRVMVPMVANRAEFATVAARLAELATVRGVAVPPIGVMIETPAAALIAATLAIDADFVSIGSNDLAQYTLAMDRGNPVVAAGADALHPAVLRLIDAACRGGARHDRPVGLCGGLAADPLAVPILLGLGIRSLSVPPARVAATKAVVAALDMDAAVRLAGMALEAGDAAAVRALARAVGRETQGVAA
jgi:phosphoenolpyruvate-protein phosphotransferase